MCKILAGRSKRKEENNTMKIALTVGGSLGFWSLAYLCAWVYPRITPMTEGMGSLLFFTGAIMFLLSVACICQLLYWWLLAVRRELSLDSRRTS
jgi:hypothetical protein